MERQEEKESKERAKRLGMEEGGRKLSRRQTAGESRRAPPLHPAFSSVSPPIR